MSPKSNILAKIDKLIEEAKKFLNSTEYKKALDTSQKAYFLAMEHNYPKGKVGALDLQSSITFIMGDMFKAREYLLQALEVLKDFKDDYALNTIYSKLGNTYCELGLAEEGLKYLSLAIDVSKKFKEKKKLTVDYINIAIALTKHNFYTKASQYFDKAQKFAEKDRDEVLLCAIYSNKAFLSATQKDYPKALDEAFIALEYCQKNNITRNMMMLYYSIGSYYFYMSKVDDSIEYLNKSLDLALKYNMEFYIVYAHLQLADCYNSKKMYEKAEEHIQNAEKCDLLKDNIRLKTRYFETYLSLLEEMGDFRRAYEKHKELLEFEKEKLEKQYKTRLEAF